MSELRLGVFNAKNSGAKGAGNAQGAAPAGDNKPNILGVDSNLAGSQGDSFSPPGLASYSAIPGANGAFLDEINSQLAPVTGSLEWAKQLEENAKLNGNYAGTTPGATSAPGTTPAPGTAPTPGATPAPDATTVPGVTPSPGATATPGATPMPDPATGAPTTGDSSLAQSLLTVFQQVVQLVSQLTGAPAPEIPGLTPPGATAPADPGSTTPGVTPGEPGAVTPPTTQPTEPGTTPSTPATPGLPGDTAPTPGATTTPVPGGESGLPVPGGEGSADPTVPAEPDAPFPGSTAPDTPGATTPPQGEPGTQPEIPAEQQAQLDMLSRLQEGFDGNINTDGNKDVISKEELTAFRDRLERDGDTSGAKAVGQIIENFDSLKEASGENIEGLNKKALATLQKGVEEGKPLGEQSYDTTTETTDMKSNEKGLSELAGKMEEIEDSVDGFFGDGNNDLNRDEVAKILEDPSEYGLSDDGAKALNEVLNKFDQVSNASSKDGEIGKEDIEATLKDVKGGSDLDEVQTNRGELKGLNALAENREAWDAKYGDGNGELGKDGLEDIIKNEDLDTETRETLQALVDNFDDVDNDNSGIDSAQLTKILDAVKSGKSIEQLDI